MKQAHIFINGAVQGVGYRQFVKNWAKKHNVTGLIRNLPDGRVEAIVQGDEKDLEDLFKQLQKGPFLAEVKDIEVRWEEGKEHLQGFIILS